MGCMRGGGNGNIWVAMMSPQMPTVGAGSSQREDSPARPPPRKPSPSSPSTIRGYGRPARGASRIARRPVPTGYAGYSPSREYLAQYLRGVDSRDSPRPHPKTDIQTIAITTPNLADMAIAIPLNPIIWTAPTLFLEGDRLLGWVALVATWRAASRSQTPRLAPNTASRSLTTSRLIAPPRSQTPPRTP